tara:strand:- start:1039 stop:1362 length:324 start_codon:yes stop_codon:yes gene_type:complete
MPKKKYLIIGMVTFLMTLPNVGSGMDITDNKNYCEALKSDIKTAMRAYLYSRKRWPELEKKREKAQQNKQEAREQSFAKYRDQMIKQNDEYRKELAEFGSSWIAFYK